MEQFLVLFFILHIISNYLQFVSLKKNVFFSILTRKTCEFSESIYFHVKQRHSKSIFTHQMRKTGWRMFFFFNLFKYPFVSAFQKRFVDDESQNNLKFNFIENCLRMIFCVRVGIKFNKFEYLNV